MKEPAVTVGDGAPQISVIIPTYNRAALLPALLDSWRKLHKHTSVSYELVFSDDGSTDDTLDVLRACTDLPITLQANSHGGASAARNAAVKAAIGERLLFLGDDIFPDEDLLDMHWEFAQKHGEKVAILGRIDWHPQQKHNHLIHHITEVGNEQFSFNCLKKNDFTDFRHFYTCNISISKTLLDKEAVKFDPKFYKVNFEDTELSYRLSRHGMKIFYAPDASGLHYHEYDVQGFCRRQHTAGEMAVVFRTLHPEVDEIFSFHLIEEHYDRYIEANGLQGADVSKVGLVIERAKEYEAEIAAGLPPVELSREILSIIYRALFKLKFAEGLLSQKSNYDQNTANNFLYAVYFGEEFYNALRFCDQAVSGVKRQDLTAEKSRNIDLVSCHFQGPLKVESPSFVAQFFTVEGIKRILKRSGALRQLHERLYGAKIQDFAANLALVTSGEEVSLAVLLDPGASDSLADCPAGLFGVTVTPVESGRCFDAAGYDYVYDLRGGKRSAVSWQLKNLLLALANRKYDYIMLSHSYEKQAVIGVTDGFGQLIVSAELYATGGAVLSGRSGRVARLLPAPARVSEENPIAFMGADRKFSITPAGLLVLGGGSGLEAEPRGEGSSPLPVIVFEKPVIFVVTIFMAVGGAERNIIEVMRALRHKYTFVVITTERHTKGLGSLHHQVAEFSDEIYDLAELAAPEDFMRLFGRLKSAYTPQALLVTNGSPWFLANSANIRELFQDLPIIDHQVYDQNAGWIQHYLDPGIQSFDYFVAINRKIESVMLTEKRIPRDKVRQIYHAVNVERIEAFRRTPVSRRTVLAKHGIPAEKNVFIMVARLSEQKQPLDFLKLVTLRQGIDSNEHFVLVGDGHLRPQVDKFIAANKLQNITCLPYVDNPVALISAADAMIFTSSYEGLPVAMLEALSLGVPIFATDVGDISVVLQDYGAGMTFAPDSNIQQYNRKFSVFREQQAGFTASVTANSEAIIERFCPRTIAAQYDELFVQCLSQSRAPE